MKFSFTEFGLKRLPARKMLLGVCVVIVLATALALRVQVIHETIVDSPVRADAADYFYYALNMQVFGIYSRSDAAFKEPPSRPVSDDMRPPLYPIMLGMLIDFPPHQDFLDPVLRAHVVLGVVTVALTMLVGWLLLGPWAGVAAGWLTALSPHLISMETYLLTETLFTCLLIAAVTLLILARRCNDRKAFLLALLAGMVMAASALTRSTSLYLPVFLLIIAVAWLPAWRRPMIGCLLGFVLLISPWMIRNAGDSVENSNELTKSFLQHGMYPGMMYQDNPQSLGMPYRFDPHSQITRKSVESVVDEIVRRFEEEPGRHVAWYLFGKPCMFWQWSIIAGQGDVFVYPVTDSPYFDNKLHVVTHSLMRILHVPLLLAAFGMTVILLLAMLFRRRASLIEPDLALVAMVLVYATALHMVGAPFPRYSIPFRPELYVVALAGFIYAARFLTSSHTMRRLLRASSC